MRQPSRHAPHGPRRSRPRRRGADRVRSLDRDQPRRRGRRRRPLAVDGHDRLDLDALLRGARPADQAELSRRHPPGYWSGSRWRPTSPSGCSESSSPPSTTSSRPRSTPPPSPTSASSSGPRPRRRSRPASTWPVATPTSRPSSSRSGASCSRRAARAPRATRPPSPAVRSPPRTGCATTRSTSTPRSGSRSTRPPLSFARDQTSYPLSPLASQGNADPSNGPDPAYTAALPPSQVCR